MAIPHKIIITGNVYIKYIDDNIKALIGDIMLLLNDDARAVHVGNYHVEGISGYIKAKIYDGLVWQNLVMGEFCHQRENKFSKKQRAIDSVMLCQTIVKEYKGHTMYKTYRGHFTIDEYVPAFYQRKSSRKRKSSKL
ncbi:MAG: hypothetical protein EOP33_02105 [Rickettsiaceae bacterium]|nr:MAG: hypothetical protein EOP33_02105 [Rickettsiaceae bacterium]